jgi:hypothetical protein
VHNAIVLHRIAQAARFEQRNRIAFAFTPDVNWSARRGYQAAGPRSRSTSRFEASLLDEPERAEQRH